MIAIFHELSWRQIAPLIILGPIIVVLEGFGISGALGVLTPIGVQFIIGWTGILLILILLRLNLQMALVSTLIVFGATALHDINGAILKLIAQSLTIIGVYVAQMSIDRRKVRKITPLPADRSVPDSIIMRKKDALLVLVYYIVIGALFRGVGMFYVNIVLLPLLYPASFPGYDQAAFTSFILVPLSLLQGAVDIAAGYLLYKLIPASIRSRVQLQ